MLYRIWVLLIGLLPLSLAVAKGQNTVSSVKGKVICLDPGHGGTALTDHYRVGPTGEREEWINLRVALKLKSLLEAKGAVVLMTRTNDVFIPLTDRSKISNDGQADVFLSIHHNATADSTVNFPIIYFHANATENAISVLLGKAIAKALVQHLYNGRVTPEGNFASLVSDFTIFPGAGASVLRHTYGTPAVIAEASFFTHPQEEQLLKTDSHTSKEAKAYVEALESFFSVSPEKILEKNSVVAQIAPFEVFQEAERMTPVAKRWKQDFLEAQRLMQKKDQSSLKEALTLFTRSARSFPDSYYARECHEGRATILNLLGNDEEARQARLRSREFFVSLPGL
jgi:N-acetylmuramoyl-L-alanine amidase